MPTKAELEQEIAELKQSKGDDGLRTALEQIKALGGRQGAIAADALK